LNRDKGVARKDAQVPLFCVVKKEEENRMTNRERKCKRGG
jgi:hypothetical protein